jgi:hypothetical protein
MPEQNGTLAWNSPATDSSIQARSGLFQLNLRFVQGYIH